MRRLFFLFAVSFIPFLGFSQALKTVQHEDIWLLKRLSSPQISPDGKWVVYSQTEPAYDEKEQTSDLWICSTTGTPKPRKLTATKGGEANASWSPDGTFLAFTAKREGDEESQLYLLDMSGAGEAQRITKFNSGVSLVRWSPDSRHLLLSAQWFPDCYSDSTYKKMADERKKQGYKVRAYSSFPIRNWDKWVDDKRTHYLLFSLDTRMAWDVLETSKLYDNSGFVPGSIVFSPDGTSLLLSATAEANTAIDNEPRSQVYQINLQDKSVKTILPIQQKETGSLAFSADGKTLFCLETPLNNGKVYNQARVQSYAWPSCTKSVSYFTEMDRPVTQFQAGEKSWWVSIESEGRDRIFSSLDKGKTWQERGDRKRGCLHSLSISKDGKTAVALWESQQSPAELVKIEGESLLSLCNPNADKLKTLDIPAVETFWTLTSSGRKVRSMLIRPAQFDSKKRYPLFVVMHGGPASAWKDNFGLRWNYALLASDQYALVLTDYVGSTGYGEHFAQNIQFDPFRGPGQDILDATSDALKRYSFLDSTRMAAGGASYGGHLSNWMQAISKRFRCLISHAGLVNSISQYGTSDAIYNRELMNGGTPWEKPELWLKENPFAYANTFSTPTLITVGELDYRVPVNNAIEYYHILQRKHIPSKLLVFPDENHWISKAENSRYFYNQVAEWLKKWLN